MVDGIASQKIPWPGRGCRADEPAPFQSVELPTSDLIWAGLSRPFCPPDHFTALWMKIRAVLAPGGRFAGDFFGPHHTWTENPEMDFHSREEVMALCQGLEVEYVAEEEGELGTALDGEKYWHMFSVCVRRN